MIKWNSFAYSVYFDWWSLMTFVIKKGTPVCWNIQNKNTKSKCWKYHWTRNMHTFSWAGLYSLNSHLMSCGFMKKSQIFNNLFLFHFIFLHSEYFFQGKLNSYTANIIYFYFVEFRIKCMNQLIYARCENVPVDR